MIARAGLGWAALAVVVAYATWLLAFTDSPQPASGPDTPVYLQTADVFSPFVSASSVAEGRAARSLYPPLYPLALGITGGSHEIRLAHALTTVFLLVALALQLAWLRASGLSPAMAAGLVAAFALSPATLLQALELLSENLYLLASLGALTALARAEEEASEAASARWRAIGALAVAAAVLTRTAGVALLVAFIAHLFWRRTPGRARLLLLAVAPLALWHLGSLTLGFGDSYQGTYLSKLQSFSPDPGVALWKVVGAEVAALIEAWPRAFALHPGAGTRLLAALVAALAATGLVQRVRSGYFDGLYAAAYLGMLLVWPFPEQVARFLVVVQPVLLFHAICGAEVLARRVALPAMAWAGRGLIAGVLLATLPSFAHFVVRHAEASRHELSDFASWPGWYVYPPGQAEIETRYRRAMARANHALGELVPEGECVFSVIPMEVEWRARRASQHVPWESVDDATFESEALKCDWFFLSLVPTFPFRTAFYPRDRMGDRIEPVHVFRDDGLPGAPVYAVLARRATAK